MWVQGWILTIGFTTLISLTHGATDGDICGCSSALANTAIDAADRALTTNLQQTIDDIWMELEDLLENATQSTLLDFSESTKAEAAAAVYDASAHIEAICREYCTCAEIKASKPEADSGVYELFIDGRPSPRLVYCDMETDGGGWVVVQRRQDGSEDFNRNWDGYKGGFGDIENEFYLGNDDINGLTIYHTSTLRVHLEGWSGESAYAVYDGVKVADESGNYALALGSYQGTAGDALSVSNSAEFTTLDRDNDAWPDNCAAAFGGGFWYKHCHGANLNGRYYYRGNYSSEFADGIEYDTWHSPGYSLRAVTMMLRPQT